LPATVRHARPTQALSPDLCVTAAYGAYLPPAFLALPPRGTLNIHPSLLPRYRGAAPVQRALQAGDAVSGVTLAYTVQAMDSGPVLAQTRVALVPEDTHTALLARLFDIGARMLLAELPSVRMEPRGRCACHACMHGADTPVRACVVTAHTHKQTQALDGSAAARAVPQDGAAACPAPKVAPEEGLLAWSDSAATLHNKVRTRAHAKNVCVPIRIA
jgi:methionyl-tRNA formyltransferase